MNSKTINEINETHKLIGRFLHRIDEVSATDWNALFNSNSPFTSHAFLSALESSGCTTAKTGWAPHHLLVYLGEQLVAAMPCYLKSHSYGEYIFDWSWAEAYERNGLEYYPKIVNAIPYTPATGPRLGIAPEYHHLSAEIIACIHQTLQQLCSATESSNWQSLFVDASLNQQLQAQGWIARNDVQFHWFNRHYKSFDDFVGTFTSRKRKNVLKERRRVLEAGVTVKTLEGDEIDDALWQQFFLFYQLTYMKRSRHGGYLNLEFFTALSKTMAANIMMVIAQKDDETIAASLFFKSDNSLYGRYWGCVESYQFLHFECCYYQGIDYCIEHNLKRFDAGAQGEHKLQRGFEPIKTYANYYIQHPQFAHAIADYLRQEQTHIEQYIESAKTQLPYKNE